MSQPSPDKKPKGTSANRVAIWVLAGGAGLYLLISGIIGIAGG